MKLSIITINLDNQEGLKNTVKSVLSQNSFEFEYIIIDGNSMDESKKFVEDIAFTDKRITYFISESDTGIYNAMNKGIRRANGEYCLFLNSGDYLADNNVVKDFNNKNFREDIISAEIKDDKVNLDCVDFNFLYNLTLPHPSTFIKKSLFDKYGYYNEQNKIVSDWEFFFKCIILYNCSYIHYNRVITVFNLSGISSQPENWIVQKQEREFFLKTKVPYLYQIYNEKLDCQIEYQKLMSKYNEYLSLKNGKFSIIIKVMLRLIKLKNKLVN